MSFIYSVIANAFNVCFWLDFLTASVSPPKKVIFPSITEPAETFTACRRYLANHLKELRLVLRDSLLSELHNQNNNGITKMIKKIDKK